MNLNKSNNKKYRQMRNVEMKIRLKSDKNTGSDWSNITMKSIEKTLLKLRLNAIDKDP